jgi:PAS domain S-box-containing protein
VNLNDLLEESIEDLYEEAPCGYLSALPGGTIVKVNQTFLDWTGFQRDDLVGRRRFQDLLAPGGRIFHETHYAPLLRMQGSVREIALEVVCADGRRLPVLVNSVLKVDDAGAPRLVRTTVFNATHRKEYERELMRERQRAEQESKAKGDFISMVSHEIRTPLNAILAVAHLLGSTELSAQQQKLVRILRSSCEGLLDLINEILDLSKIESGKLSLEERPFDLRQVVEGVASGQRVKTEEKGLALEVHMDDRLPSSLLGDPVKIGQVLTNLAGNAVKFTAKGSVTLDLRVLERTPEAVSVELRVTDTGIGIEKERLPHIFDDFTQASYEIGMKYGGTGLGLSIAQAAGGDARQPAGGGERAGQGYDVLLRPAAEARGAGPGRRRDGGRAAGAPRPQDAGRGRQRDQRVRPHGVPGALGRRIRRGREREGGGGVRTAELLRSGPHGSPDAGDGRLRGGAPDPVELPPAADLRAVGLHPDRPPARPRSRRFHGVRRQADQP